MLRVLSAPRRLCTGLTRRDLLQVGGLGMFGLSAGRFLELESAAAENPTPLASGFGKAKRCILLFLYGSPSQLETFDMKPEAPVEIRGTMKPIPSSLAGLDVCELLPHTAKVMDRVTVVRSVHHQHPVHGVAFATTGIPSIDVGMELRPYDPAHHPYFGSAVQYVDRQMGRHPERGVPQNIGLPFPFSSQRTGEVHRAGPYAAFLGSQYNPLWAEFAGEPTRSVEKTLADTKIDCHDPYLGTTAESHFRLAMTERPTELTVDRLDRRRSLLQQLDGARRDLERTSSGSSLSSFQEMAFSLLTSDKVATSLDVRRESTAIRELYGHTLFGQACLAARRTLEAGTRLVSVFWDEYGLAGDAWDTHWNHYPRMKDQLLPGFDRAFSGLILDLEQRGMLDDTLVFCISEHGRTPKLNRAKGGGRDHWSRAYSALFAGGGVARGNVVGATDQHAADVIDTPVSPKDVLATMYFLLGIDPHTRLRDRAGRTHTLMPGESRVIPQMLA